MKQDVINFDLRDIKKGTQSPSLEYILQAAQYDFGRFYQKNKTIIEAYKFWSDKLEEIEYRKSLSYKLTKIKNRDAKGSIVARIKWKFPINGKVKNPPYLFVYVCSVEDYPLGIEDQKVKILAKEKIDDYFTHKLPLILQDIEGNTYTL